MHFRKKLRVTVCGKRFKRQGEQGQYLHRQHNERKPKHVPEEFRPKEEKEEGEEKAEVKKGYDFEVDKPEWMGKESSAGPTG